MAMPTLSPISLGSFSLAAADIGQGPPTLLIAGLGGRAVFWQRQVPALVDDFRLVLHDHRGTGGSSAFSGPFSIAQMAGDVLDLMDHFDVESANIVGHSTGGAIGQYLAIHHKDRVNRLVISASWSRPSAYFDQLFDLRLTTMERLDPAAYTMDGSLRGFPADYLAANLDILDGAGPAQVPDQTVQRGRIEAILAHDLFDRLPEIEAETLVVCAEDDAITPRPYSDEIAAAIQGARQHVLSSGGHFAPQSQAEAYTPVIHQFLKGESV